MSVWAITIAAGVALTGCSLSEPSQRDAGGVAQPEAHDSDPPTDASTAGLGGTSASQRVDPRTGGLNVGFGEWAVTLEADEIRPGPVTFVIRNGGALVHGFEIEGKRDGREVKLEGPEFGPNDVLKIRTELPAGTYEIECFVGDHDDMGMRTTLVVSPDAPLERDDAGTTQPDTARIADFAFSPDQTEVPVGTELTWTNDDPTAHTVTADDGSFDSGVLDSGSRFSFVFDRPGTFTYACAIHPSMRGTVLVS
jgi:plastocyanin